ncbi:hypothetical protein MMC30_005197 [Trapelia coarctata]|nr:hypothetical protein [Trapelia coarctata]
MEGSLSLTALQFFLAAICAYFILTYFFGFKYDPKEPPLVPQKIPYIGHLIGIVRHGPTYYSRVSAKYPLPIYTLGMLKGRTYAITSPDLVAAVQRSPKVFSFNPFVLAVSQRLCGCSQAAMEIVADNLDDRGIVADTKRYMHTAMAPGLHLDTMNETMIENVAALLGELDAELDACGDGVKELDLYAWARHLVSLASTDAIYGVENPFRKDRRVEDAFWDFEADITKLILNVAPSIIAPKGFQGRETVVRAFTEYIRKGHWNGGAALAKVRQVINAKYGITPEDSARFEVTNVIGILVNTAPATFWLIMHACSHPGLLEDLRKEVEGVLHVSRRGDNGTVVRTLDISLLKTRCPLLLSTYQELLRHHSSNASVRWVMQDTLLADKYLLKKDGIIQMPSKVMHADTEIWGPTAAEFDPRRFIKVDPTIKEEINGGVSGMGAVGEKAEKAPKQHPASFRAFGGGSTLCPGRFFATTEIMSVVAMFLLRFDIEPVGGRELVLPTQVGNSLATSIQAPTTDVRVRVRRRGGWEGGRWGLVRTESKEVWGLRSG